MASEENNHLQGVTVTLLHVRLHHITESLIIFFYNSTARSVLFLT